MRPVRYHVISTPTGRRVLHDFHNWTAFIDDGYDAANPTVPREFLRFRLGERRITPQPDGIWIGQMHLFSIAVTWTLVRKWPVPAREIAESLFYNVAGVRPDVADVLRRVFAEFDPISDPWDRALAPMVGTYDAVNGVCHPPVRLVPPQPQPVLPGPH